MFKLVVFSLLVASAAAKPGYYNSAPINPAQGGGAYGVGPSGYPNSHLGRDVSYTRTDVVSKQIKGRAPHSTTNFNGDPSNLLQNAVLHSVKNVHYAEENIASAPIGSPLQESPQPQIHFGSPNVQQAQQAQQLPAQFSRASGGYSVRFNRGRRPQAQAQADAQAIAQTLQDLGFENVQFENLELPDTPQGQFGMLAQQQPAAQFRRSGGGPGGGFAVRFNRGRRTRAEAQADAQRLAQTLQDLGFDDVQLQNLDLPDSGQGQALLPPSAPQNSNYKPAFTGSYGAPANNYYQRRTYYY